MVEIANKRSVMTLYSSDACPYCHRTRFVLAEKGIGFEVTEVDPTNLPEDLIELNPYNNVPTLVDRTMVLYSSSVIMEYLDERFPHPPLLPIDPVSRASSRLYMYRVNRDWYRLMDVIESGSAKEADNARKALRDSLSATAPVFNAKPYFMSGDFSLVDCCIAPLLWRLSELKVSLPTTQAKLVWNYAERLFARDSFQACLTDREREMRS